MVDIDTSLDTVPKILERNVRKFGNSPAYREKEFGIWQTWTWAQANQEIMNLSKGLINLGVKEGDHVAAEGHGEGGGNGHGKADEEAGLVGLVMAAHVADGVQAGDDPEPRGDERKQHAQRFDSEGEGDAWEELDQFNGGLGTVQDLGEQAQDT